MRLLRVTVRKRDHACLWFKHLPREIASVLEPLTPDAEISLEINGHLTIWQRMKPGGNRPTPGIRLAQGRPVWDPIEIGAELQLAVLAVANSMSLTKGNSGQIPISPVHTPRSPAARTLRSPMFHGYLIADYSGAADRVQQKRAIRVGSAEHDSPPTLVDGSFTRETLLLETVRRLRCASERGERLCIGNDHQYGVPLAFAHEIGVGGHSWRQALEALLTGKYGGPPLGHPKIFASQFNEWLRARGNKPYFFSATKSREYGLPATNPRTARDASIYRLTEQCQSMFGRGKPKPFNRVGDNGSVGGQTLVGLGKLRELMIACDQLGIPLRCWPMDGLDIADSNYTGAHVLVEPYPSASRGADVPQSDGADALAGTQLVWEADRKGYLRELLDLGDLPEVKHRTVMFEGWIVGHTLARANPSPT